MSEELREAGEGLGVQKETIPVREEQARPRGRPSSERGQRWGGEGDGRSRGLWAQRLLTGACFSTLEPPSPPSLPPVPVQPVHPQDQPQLCLSRVI